MSSKHSTLPNLDTAPDVYQFDPPVATADSASSSSKELRRAQQLRLLRTELDALAGPDSESEAEDEDAAGGLEAGTSATPDTQQVNQAEGPSTWREAPNASSAALLEHVTSLSQTVAKVHAMPGVPVGPTGPSLASLSRALDELTRSVGLGDARLDTRVPLGSGQMSLADAVSQLEHQISLLTQPRQLDAVTRRVKALAAQMERQHAERSGPGVASSAPTTVKESSEKKGDPELEQRLASLVRIQARIEPLLPLSSTLVARMRSLSGVHAQAAEVATTLARNADAVATLQGQQKHVAHLAHNLESAMNRNAQVTQTNWNALAQRTDRLAERIARLQGSESPAPLLPSGTVAMLNSHPDSHGSVPSPSHPTTTTAGKASTSASAQLTSNQVQQSGAATSQPETAPMSKPEQDELVIE